MKLHRQLNLFFMVIAFICTSTQGAQYKYIDQRSASGIFENPHYRFSYSAPSSAFQSSTWEHFEGDDNKRSTLLRVGLNGYDTYAVSVQYKGSVDPDMTPLQAASRQYKIFSFSAYEGNIACASSATEKPIVISANMIGHIAYCIDKVNKSLYEVSITWRSLALQAKTLDGVIQESLACKKELKLSPLTKCPDYLGELQATYNLLLSSFKPIK